NAGWPPPLPYCSAHQSLLRQSRRPRAVPLGLEALLELKEAGKVRFIGMSRHIAPSDGPHCHGCFRCLPIPYSAVEREHEAAIATAAQNGAGIVIRGGAATEHQPKGSRLDCNGNAGAGRISMTCSTACPLGFILLFRASSRDLDTTIVGTISPAHLQTNLDILEQGPLPPDLYEEAKQRLAAAGWARQARGG